MEKDIMEKDIMEKIFDSGLLFLITGAKLAFGKKEWEEVKKSPEFQFGFILGHYFGSGEMMAKMSWWRKKR